MSSHLITLGKIDGGAALKLDVARLIVSRALIFAASGGGKSWLLRLILEGLSGVMQTIVFDSESEFASLRELRDMVLVGPGGEVPAEPRSASLLCRRLMERNVSAVIDVSELSLSDRRDFVTNFVNTMVDLPRPLWRRCAVAVDEIQEYAPEGTKTESGTALSRLANKGRKRSYCLLGATQRLKMLDKDIAAALKNVFIGQATLDIDQQRAAGILGFDRKRWSEIRDLSPPGHEGEFFAFGPALIPRGGVVKFRAAKVKTTHPEPGQNKAAEPPAPSKKILGVLEELRDLPAAAEAEIRDLATAKAEIVKLQRDIRSAAAQAIPPSAKYQPTPQQLRDAAQQARQYTQTLAQLRKGLEDAMKMIEKLRVGAGGVVAGVDREMVEKIVHAAVDEIVQQSARRDQQRGVELEKLRREGEQLLARLSSLVSAGDGAPAPLIPTQAAMPPRRRVQSIDAEVPANGDGAGAFRESAPRRMIAILANSPGYQLGDKKLAARAGVSIKTSTWRGAMTDLKKQDLVESADVDGVGGRRLTAAGIELAQSVAPMPTGAKLLAYWRRQLGDSSGRRMFEALLAANGVPMTRSELGERAQVDPSKSTYRGGMTELRSWDIVAGKADALTLSEELLDALADAGGGSDG